jgi:hypothetical protein
MNAMKQVKALIIQLAANGVSAMNLRNGVKLEHRHLSEVQLQSAILGLQEEDRLFGQEVDGQWFFTTIDKSAPDYVPLEYSPAFAEMIIATSCEEFVEIDPDELIAQLDQMLAKARSKPGEKN